MAEEKVGFFERLKNGLAKTRNNIVSSIDSIFGAFSSIDEEFYEELEEILIMGDIGVRATEQIIEQLKSGNPFTVTEGSMTRFMMSLEEAVDLVMFAFENAEQGDIMVQKAPAATITTLVQAIQNIFGTKLPVETIGIRHGEKLYESLLTKEEAARAIDMGGFYRVPSDKRDLNYGKFFDEGNKEAVHLDEYNSDNTEQLTVEAMMEKLLELKYVQEELKGWVK